MKVRVFFAGTDYADGPNLIDLGDGWVFDSAYSEAENTSDSPSPFVFVGKYDSYKNNYELPEEVSARYWELKLSGKI